jgi:short-subunit dehydrogenase
MELRGAACLVTGASSGIGRATAVRLARLGARVVALGRDEASLRDVADRTGGRVVVADLARAEEVDHAAGEATEAFGRVDVLVNNAGEGWAGPFSKIDPDTAGELVAVNLTAPIRLTRALLPAMLERGQGHVVNVASIAGHVGVGGEAVYAATKGGLIAFSESLRYELAGTCVAVSVVTPGVVATSFFERRGRPYDRSFPKQIPATAVAEAVERAITTGRAEVFAPPWMLLPARLRGAVPGLYRRLAGRFG